MNEAGRLMASLVSSDLVVGSGVFDVMVDGVKTEFDRRGIPVSDVSGLSLSDSDVRRLLSVSAFSRLGMREDALAARLYGSEEGARVDPVAGHVVGAYAGAVSDEALRASSSSGGLTTWLLGELLSSGRIDGVIHLKQSRGAGHPLFEYGVSRTLDEIRSDAKTKYYPGHLGATLPEVLAGGGRYALVGIPSVLYEARLACEAMPALSERLPYFVGLICGHQKSRHYADSLGWQVGIDPGALEWIDFRVKLPERRASAYGTRLVGSAADGKPVDITVPTSELYGTDWGLGFFKVNFSDYADDVLNETADVVFGDAWLPQYLDDSRGTNVVIARTNELKELLERGRASRELKLDDIDVADVRRSQAGLVRHGRELLPTRFEYLRSRGEFVPRMRYDGRQKASLARRHVQRMRVKMARESHSAFLGALESRDFAVFGKSMKSLTREYELSYRAAGMLAQLRRRFA
ncbi:Coenzyme F420 hydrogenase/dehydrogenase, beta subunit C-terminal domain [Microbacterium schleiferi]|uniref:Coenzyme F420 hydrogenase/dehydrogenase, beta subunit C-terminal domain n=1 Tax=Microbacterium schleiferi TaxID=69362 RepID=A0A7S8RI43_9MICO|nr:Coenzyme F420 hydrogenase/dehydrogenase, beta subunit C-terminal domain [Microbacterium schleiferi]QPE05001.1 Coenzyme F420 hydrogenase/dehydrogenase, beta subunit C-terminal domain [Microbacterium schleiferi]